MKFINTLAIMAMSVAVAMAKGEAPKPSTEDHLELKASDLNIQKWMTPELLAGIITFLFLVFMTLFGLSFMTAIQVPLYQLKANDEKNKDENRDWSRMWGKIETS